MNKCSRLIENENEVVKTSYGTAAAKQT